MKIITLDPMGKYPDAQEFELLEACGLLPCFIQSGDTSPMKEQLQNNYGFPIHWEDCRLDKNFLQHDPVQFVADPQFAYTDDPNLAPYAVIQHGSSSLYIYRYGLVVLIEGEHFLWARMD